MLAFADDAAFARLVIAATAIPRPARSRWLRDIASRIDPPRIPPHRCSSPPGAKARARLAGARIEITNVRITDRGAGGAYRAAGGGPGRPNRVKGTTPEKLAATAINSGREALR
jgi:hypothetical protein